MKKHYTILILFLGLAVAGCDKASEMGLAAGGPGTTAGTGGSMARFTVVGNYLYAVDEQNLNVFDITNAADPVFRRSVPVGFEIETVFPFKNRLFIGSTSMVHIFNIDNPAYPVKLSEAISPTAMRRCDPVVAKDTVAYATLRTNGPCGGVQSILAVYDIRDISNPVQISSVPVGEPYGLGYSGQTLYVCDRMQGLLVFDISHPFQPQWIRTMSDASFIDVIPYGDLLICWTTSGMLLYDISDANNPALLTSIL